MAGIDNNTVLYLRGDSFKDLSPNPKTITNNGVAISDNCLEFGTSKRLIVGSSSEFAFGSGDFTVEVDAYLTAYSESDIFVSNNNFKDFYFNVSQGNSKLRLDVSYDPHYSKNTVPLNTWNHLCVTRKDGIVYLFINGKLEFTGINNGVIKMTSPRIGYHDTYPNDKITGKLKNIRISNIARYTEDFTPPTQPFNSININVTNKTATQIDFNVSKLGQETINKVEVLQNDVVKETYTDNFDNLTYNIDSSLCAIGNNKITIRVAYDNNYVEEEVLIHTVTVNNLPTSSSLKDVIDRQELLNNNIEIQKNILKNILVGKNVEVEEENKLSNLIDKVNELGDAPPPPLYLYKEGDECVDITGGFNLDIKNSNASFDKLSDRIKMNASGTNSHIYIATTNKIDITNFSKLYVEADYTTSTKSGFRILLKNSYGYGNEVATLNRTSSFEKTILSLDINTFTGSYFVDVFLGNTLETSATASANIYNIWLEV